MSATPPATPPAAADAAADSAADALPPHLQGADLRNFLSTVPAGALLSALEDRPGMGWVIKDAHSLRYSCFKGSLPHADTAVCRDASPQPGQTDADRFERAQASILRLSDLRALKTGRPMSEVHRFETHWGLPGSGVREWRAWRWTDGRWLFILWIDMGVQERHDAEIQQAQRQLQAQQLLISRMTAQLQGQGDPAHAEIAAARASSLEWAGEQFAAQLRREVDLSRREHRNFCLLLLELDTQGLDDAAATTVVGTVAQHLASSTRAMDTVAQLGPCRFGILLSGAALSPAHARAEALRRHLAAQVVVSSDHARPMSLSIGLAAYPHGASSAEALMAAAMDAVQEAAASGGNRTVMGRVPLGDPPP